MKRGTDNLAKFLFLQKDLKLPKFAAVGLLQTLWDFTAVNTPEGNIGKFTNEEIALVLGYEDDPDILIECLTRRGWLDENSAHRLIIHHWPDHCENTVHERLAKERRFFADGSIPKLTSLKQDARPAIEMDYKRLITERDGAAPEIEPTAPESFQDQPGIQESAPVCPAPRVNARKRASTSEGERVRASTLVNALTEPSRAEPSHTEPSHAEPNRAGGPAPPGEPVSVGQSAVSSVSDLSASALAKAKPRPKAEAQELFERLLEVSGEPPAYRAWWRDIGGLMRNNGGMDVLVEAIEYAEKCRDPVIRKAKDLGELTNPAAFIASKCKSHLAPFGIKLPAPPKEARSA